MKKASKVILLSLAVILIAFGALFVVYVSDYSKADEIAIQTMTNGQAEGRITVDDNLTIFHSGNDDNSALIYYPGGKVDEVAYYPLLQRIADQGITCVLVKMPFHLAVFNQDAADEVYDKLPNIEHWYIGGHSLGGAMASNYLTEHKEQLDGLILLGAYIYGDVKPEDVLTIYGSKDLVLNKEKITYNQNVIEIDGGNHANFGYYGEQKGDGIATITREEQQEYTAKEIVAFIRSKE